MKGLIMDIQRFCLHDGPGVRTTVFFKGCNMSCKWCHNPESMESKPVLMFHEDKCIRCGICQANCPNGVHRISKEGHFLDRDKCRDCALCTELCPTQALEINGYYADTEQILSEIEADAKYYERSGGGVTFSGGEATLQFEFLMELMHKCKEKGYQTALETNGMIGSRHLEECIPWVDLFLLDYKMTGSEHTYWTGAPIEPVLATLEALEKAEKKVSLRCPIIPGVNDREEHFAAIRELQEKYNCIISAEIMAYHDIGRDKWKECGKKYELAHLKTVEKCTKQEWEKNIAIERRKNNAQKRIG